MVQAMQLLLLPDGIVEMLGRIVCKAFNIDSKIGVWA